MVESSVLALERDVPLAPRTTLGVGGAASFFVAAHHVETLAAADAWAAERGLPLLILGGGSNLLVSDGGFPGVVVDLCPTEIEWGTDGRVRVAAGVGWDDLVAAACERDWQGIECLSGIPGRVGASPIQNVGAYGQEVSQTIESVEVWDRQAGALAELAARECDFAYRNSLFKTTERYVVVGVTFRLRPHQKPTLRYRELVDALAGEQPPLLDVRRKVIELRRKKSMVLDPTDDNRRSAGSFFTNPIVEAKHAEAARERAEVRGVDGKAMPAFVQPDGLVKLSAAWLIERAGMPKGYGDGPVGLSTRHTLAIVNRGSARASDVVSFARHVRERVRDAFGVVLHPEPAWVGFSSEEKRAFESA